MAITIEEMIEETIEETIETQEEVETTEVPDKREPMITSTIMLEEIWEELPDPPRRREFTETSSL